MTARKLSPEELEDLLAEDGSCWGDWSAGLVRGHIEALEAELGQHASYKRAMEDAYADLDEAAAERDRLRAEVERLRAALATIAFANYNFDHDSAERIAASALDGERSSASPNTKEG